MSPSGTKGYKGVVLDISPDLPVHQRPMRAFECQDESLVRVELKVLREIRERHPQLLVQRYPEKGGSFNAHDKSASPPEWPNAGVAQPVGHLPPHPCSDASAISVTPRMSLTQAYRTAVLIAHDESDELPIRASVKDLANALATLINIIADIEADDMHHT
jgi:hypothetical protein